MGVLSSAVAAELNRPSWEQNPLLAIGLTPCILRAGFSDDDLFGICQKVARARLVEVHPDRVDEDTEEQRMFSTAFGLLKDRATFDLALAELRKIASTEERETVRIKRDMKSMKQLLESTQAHAEEVSRQHRVMQDKYEPLELFARSLVRAQASRIGRRHKASWSLPTGTTQLGVEQNVLFAMMWAHTALKEGAKETTVEEVLSGLARQARQFGEFPWEVIGQSANRERYARHYGDVKIPDELKETCEGAYPNALMSLLDLCVGIRHKRRERMVVADDLVIGFRSATLMQDGMLMLSPVGKLNRYKIFGSYRPPVNSHDYPVMNFGTSGFVEIAFDTIMQASEKKHFSPALVPGWHLIGMQVHEIANSNDLTRSPSAVQFANLRQSPFLVLGNIVAVA